MGEVGEVGGGTAVVGGVDGGGWVVMLKQCSYILIYSDDSFR